MLVSSGVAGCLQLSARIVLALAIPVAGTAVGSFFGSAVKVAGSNARFPGGGPAGVAVKYLIGVFALVMALEHLQLATLLSVTTLQIVIAAVALALALAFGLGGKDHPAAQTVKSWPPEAEAQQEKRVASRQDEAP